ncbi:MAG: hypothetical protein M3Y88_02520 [Chloroflexota bacterium]|nr:hypothetical protein [Chloroflexota bacterium]
MLPVIWTLFALSAVAGFIVIAAYWLDVQDRPDLTLRSRIAWSAGTFLFPLTIPAYALVGGAGWPLALRIGAFVPAVAIGLFLGFAFGIFR